ncbi:MAG: site-specific integrase [Victivallaceae bacterium]|nr:site-specific integrase [Victivallaceae bacterium]
MARKTTGRIYRHGLKGYFYLRYKFEGKETRTRLLDPDGKPIIKELEARAAADRVLARIHETNKAEQLRTLKNDIQDADEAAKVAEINLNNSKAAISKGWALYMSCPSRLKSCKRYSASKIPPKSMADSYKTYYSRFVDWMKSNYPETVLLSGVTPEQAAAFANDLQTHVAPGTFNKYRFFLTAFFDALSTDGKISIERNPFASVERMDGTANSRRELTIAELQTIIEKATGDLKLLLQVGTFTGLRLGDCCTLQWGEIDMTRQIIRRKPRKTANRTQKVVVLGIPSPLLYALSGIPANCRNGYLLPHYAETYLSSGGTGKMTRIIQRHFMDCGIAIYAPGTGLKCHYEGKHKVYDESTRAVVQVGFHSLRHTWVSLHAMRGTPQAIIQDAAGHANPAMTEHYVHISPEAARRAAAALEIPQLAGADVIDVPAEPEAPERDELRKLADMLDIEQIREILEKYKTGGGD